MSEHEDFIERLEAADLDPVSVTSPPHALTREQVIAEQDLIEMAQAFGYDLRWVGFCMKVKALRHALTQQAQEVERLTKDAEGQAVRVDALRKYLAQAITEHHNAGIKLAAMTAERDEARAIVAKVNNAVLGSDGYFTEPSCIEAIGALKVQCNQLQATLAAREQAIKELEHEAVQEGEQFRRFAQEIITPTMRVADTGPISFGKLKEVVEAAIHTARQDAARLREAALWAMKKVKRLSTRAVDYKRADDFIQHEEALKGA